MHKRVFLLVMFLELLAQANAGDAAPITWVSGIGKDTGTCLISAPCRTFAYAHAQTTGGGSINVLSSGSFGPITITKSLSIVAQGVEAVIDAASGGAAISVQAGAGGIVSLRGVTIDLRGASSTAISFVSGTALHVRDSHIRRSQDGIRFAPSTGVGELYVDNTIISATNQFGVVVEPSNNAAARVLISNTKVENGIFGLLFEGSGTSGLITATVRETICDGNGNVGIFARDTGTGATVLTLHRVTSANNLFGVVANGAAATVRLGESTVAGNNTGLLASNAATIASFSTNQVSGNGVDNSPTTTISLK